METTKWNIDKAHTNLTFTIAHFVIAKVKGTFKEFEGSVSASNNDFEDAKLDFSIVSNSIDTNDIARDNHLKTPDFFDIQAFPLITFKSKSFKKDVGKTFLVVGILTVNGVENEIRLNAEYNGTFEHPQYKKTIASFDIVADIIRKDFNIGLNYPAAALGDKVILNGTIELIKQ